LHKLYSYKCELSAKDLLTTIVMAAKCKCKFDSSLAPPRLAYWTL